MEKKGRTAMLQLLLDVWMDFLVYGANRCSRESHAKKLSNGGELTTILWIMTDYLHLNAYNAARAQPRRHCVRVNYYRAAVYYEQILFCLLCLKLVHHRVNSFLSIYHHKLQACNEIVHFCLASYYLFLH